MALHAPGCWRKHLDPSKNKKSRKKGKTLLASICVWLSTHGMSCILRRYSWGHIVIDEGHRLKDASCKLATE
eukprot:scaffold40544_cov15-Tisochrysis_lutea.AAC.2